jgi:hypothetical protein
MKIAAVFLFEWDAEYLLIELPARFPVGDDRTEAGDE